MKSLGFISQIATVGVAVVIALFYVQPTVEKIGQIQSDISDYQTEREKIASINATLANHVTTIETITPANKQLLATYMPPAVDDIAVMRDIEFIATSVGVAYTQLEYESAVARSGFDRAEEVPGLGDIAAVPHSFAFSADGSYDQIKALLRAFEQNNYPLEVHGLSISQTDGTDMLSAQMSLVTYADALVNNSN